MAPLGSDVIASGADAVGGQEVGQMPTRSRHCRRGADPTVVTA